VPRTRGNVTRAQIAVAVIVLLAVLAIVGVLAQNLAVLR
jgi:hypothetical protein